MGIGANNSIARIGNVVVQILPPEITFEDTEDFTDGVADLFQGQEPPWGIVANRYEATASETLVNTTMITVAPASILDLTSTRSTPSTGGIVFDQPRPDHFKFAAISAITGEVLIGHHTARGGWAIDASVAAGIVAGTDYELGVSLKGISVSVTLGGEDVLGHVFNAVVVDGEFGVLTHGGTSSFDTFTIQTNDPDGGSVANLMAVAASLAPAENTSTLTAEALSPIVDEAVSRWLATGIADPASLVVLDTLTVQIRDLPGFTLGQVQGGNLSIDSDAAGFGWFVDTTQSHGVCDIEDMFDG